MNKLIDFSMMHKKWSHFWCAKMVTEYEFLKLKLNYFHESRTEIEIVEI